MADDEITEPDDDTVDEETVDDEIDVEPDLDDDDLDLDDDDVVAEQVLDHATDGVVGHGPVEGLHEVGRGEVPNLVTGLDGGVAQGEPSARSASLLTTTRTTTTTNCSPTTTSRRISTRS